MKENLDPLGKYSERELLAALKGVQLWDVLAGVSFSQAKAADVAAEPRPVASSPVNTSMASSAPVGIMGEYLTCSQMCRCVCDAYVLHHVFPPDSLHNHQYLRVEYRVSSQLAEAVAHQESGEEQLHHIRPQWPCPLSGRLLTEVARTGG